MSSNRIKKWFANLLLIVLVPYLSSAQMTKTKVDQLCTESKNTADLKMEAAKIDSAYEISMAIGYQDGIIKSRLLKAAWHLNNGGDVQPSLEIIKQVEPAVLNSGDFARISYLKLIKGNSYVKLLFNEEAERELKSALEYAEKIKDVNLRHERRGIIFMSIGAIYNDIAPAEKTAQTNYKAIKNFKDAYREMLQIKSRSFSQNVSLINSGNVLGHYYVNIGRIGDAEFYLKSALRLADSIKDYEGISYALSQLGAVEFQRKDYKASIEKYKESNRVILFSKGGKWLVKDNYSALALAYKNLGDESNHEKYVSAYHMLSDSLNTTYKKGVSEAVKVISSDLNNEHQKDKSGYMNLIAVISIAALSILALAFFIYRSYKREKKNKEELKVLLEEKMEELNMLSQTFAPEDEEKLKEVVRLAMSNDVSFVIRFNELFPKFSEKLLKISPSLKSNDLKICSYMRLDFDTKEIARYGGDSVRSVESKKYRLRKKFNISSTEDFNLWISKI